ncbi:polyprenyl synthetase family protein [Natronoflexus pectinivorans]|uniref:Geranylgeranyl diphosphate synthase type II n=1 Tax=Natronoflexus pectinivorans TaxID=682526 RepID=A0A4R2GPG3_9BACT|nr:polyprenyl synthetase family protein [Natronoflexus pectinivorans]TCO10928.1 geranylgeranyl diphosphate synthase type II [Natronoflexus pectinivorans]
MTRITEFIEQSERAIQYLITDKEPSGLYAPVSYILSLGGKRIRPALCLAGCALFDESRINQCISPAIGLEVFHNFTLLHDDFMDGSDMRRNHPTVHEKWNANTAILSGDAMLIKAYQLMLQTPDQILKPVLDLFSVTAMEVCEGQQYDMEFETRDDVTEEEYIEMIRLKTAVLLGASLKTGAMVGGADPDDADLLYNYGIHLGISFQLQDDWLDVFGDSQTFGKEIGGDITSNKKTFLLINAQNQLKGSSLKELYKWLNKKEFNRDEKVSAVRNLYEEANVSTNAKKLMDDHYKKSLDFLSKIKGDQSLNQELAGFAHQLMERSR